MDFKDELAILFRSARRAQKLSQLEITKKLKEDKEVSVGQTSLAKFENGRATLSLKALSEMAPFLNLNPEYILNGFGNPFKQATPETIIKMFFQEDKPGSIDFYLINLILEINERVSILSLKPHMPVEADRRLLRKRGSRHFYALVVMDADENLFLFRREDKDEFFDEADLQPLHLKNRQAVDYNSTIISTELFSKIREQWDEVSINDIKKVIEGVSRRENLIFLSRIIKKVSSYESSSNGKEEYRQLLERLERMDAHELEYLLSRRLPEIGRVLKSG